MNCKPGDLATVVGGRVGDRLGQALLDALLGRVVQVSHIGEEGTWIFVEPIPLPCARLAAGGGRWLVTSSNFAVKGLHDRYLRPLPPLDEDDEVLTARPLDEVTA